MRLPDTPPVDESTTVPARSPGTLIWRMLRRFPQTPAARVFLLVAFVDAFGRGFFLAGSTLFYTQVIGLTSTQVGLGLSAAGLFGVVCAIPIGWLAGRFGDGPVLIALQLWRGAAFLVYPLVDDFRLFLVVACLIGAAELAVGPIIQSVAGATAEVGSLVGAMALIAVARNTAYALSAVIVTVVITTAGTATYIGFVLANAAAFLVTAALLTRLRLPPGAAGQEKEAETPASKLLPFRNPPFLLLSLANGILFLHMPILSVAFPLWIVTSTHAPRALVGVALVVNTILAVALQVRLSKGGDDMVCAGRKQRVAGVALALFCVLTATTGSASALTAGLLLLVAAVPLTLGELWQSAGGWGLSYGLAPEAQRTYYLSVYQLGATGVMVVGPALLTVAVVNRGAAGWLGLAVVFALAGLAVPLLTRLALRGERGAPGPASAD